MAFLSTSIHQVTKVAVSSATQLSDDSPNTLIRDIVITAKNGKTYEITLFSKKDELIPLEVT